MTAISFKNVSFTYDADEDNIVKALSDVSFDVEEGEFITVCGGNGSGKSTLSKLTNGLLIPDNGKVEIYGIATEPDENDKKNKKIYDIRSKVGLIFQNPDNQMVASIIEDDVAFGPENLGVPRDEIEERITWALKTVGMEEYRRHTPTKLSGGQKQRVAIAGVLAMKPKLLILDESTSMLDPEGREEVLATVQKLNKEEGITILHVTHNMEDCLIGNRALVLKNGVLVFDGKPEDLFSDFDFVQNCNLELPPLQKAVYLLKQNGIELPSCVRTEKELALALWQYKQKI